MLFPAISIAFTLPRGTRSLEGWGNQVHYAGKAGECNKRARCALVSEA